MNSPAKHVIHRRNEPGNTLIGVCDEIEIFDLSQDQIHRVIHKHFW